MAARLVTAFVNYIQHSIISMFQAKASLNFTGQVEGWLRPAAALLTPLIYHIHHAHLAVITAVQPSWTVDKVEYRYLSAVNLSTLDAGHIHHAEHLVGFAVHSLCCAFYVESWLCRAARLIALWSCLLLQSTHPRMSLLPWSAASLQEREKNGRRF